MTRFGRSGAGFFKKSLANYRTKGLVYGIIGGGLSPGTFSAAFARIWKFIGSSSNYLWRYTADDNDNNVQSIVVDTSGNIWGLLNTDSTSWRLDAAGTAGTGENCCLFQLDANANFIKNYGPQSSSDYDISADYETSSGYTSGAITPSRLQIYEDNVFLLYIYTDDDYGTKTAQIQRIDNISNLTSLTKNIDWWDIFSNLTNFNSVGFVFDPVPVFNPNGFIKHGDKWIISAPGSRILGHNGSGGVYGYIYCLNSDLTDYEFIFGYSSGFSFIKTSVILESFDSNTIIFEFRDNASSEHIWIGSSSEAITNQPTSFWGLVKFNTSTLEMEEVLRISNANINVFSVTIDTEENNILIGTRTITDWAEEDDGALITHSPAEFHIFESDFNYIGSLSFNNNSILNETKVLDIKVLYINPNKRYILLALEKATRYYQEELGGSLITIPNSKSANFYVLDPSDNYRVIGYYIGSDETPKGNRYG